jgi:hypothetical protein
VGSTRRALAVSIALAALAAPASAAAGPGFFFGFTEDGLKFEGMPASEPGRALGAKAFRITLGWTPGQTTMSFTDAANMKRAIAAAKGLRIVVSIAGSAANAPQTVTARDEFCRYARGVVASNRQINDVVIWNEPNASRFWQPQFDPDGSSAAPAAYEALLEQCWDLLHNVRSTVNVIAPATSPRGNDNPGAANNVGHSPGAFIRKLGEAYRAGGRTRRILDTVGHHAYGDTNAERPWRQHIGSKTIAQGDWNKLMSNLETAFGGTAQPIPGQCSQGRCVSIFYMEAGFETAADAAKAGLYEQPAPPGTIRDNVGGEPSWPPPSADSPAPDQATQISDAVRLASCQPHVGAFFNFLLWDEARAVGWQSAPYWADRTPKDSLPAFQQVVGEVNAGLVDCAALKGGPPNPDYTPPGAITDLTRAAASDPLRADLTWSPSSDASGVVGYRVYRNTGYYAWSETPSFSDLEVAPATTYTYTVYAQDGAGNTSAVSNKAAVTTP